MKVNLRTACFSSVLLFGSLVAGCTTSRVVVDDDSEEQHEKNIWEKTVADFAADGDYQRAETLARAFVSGGVHPGSYRKVLKGADASNQILEKTIPPSSPWDVAMHQLNLASVLLLMGKKDEAHAVLSEAATKIEEQFDPDSQALKLTHGESEKFFKGDGYERATMYAFLAMSYLDRGEYESAIKMVKRGIASDSDAEKGEYRADYALLPYIGYLAAFRAGRVAEARGFDDMVFSICGFRPSKSPLPDCIVVAWTGGGTSRELGGEFDEIRYVRKGSLRGALDAVSLNVRGAEYKSLPCLADLNYQAVTRGRRMMDNVLEDKANVKRGFAASGNVLLAFGAACFRGASVTGNAALAVTLCAVGGVSVGLGFPTHLVGMMINAEADSRSWSVLPGRLLVVPVAHADGVAGLRGYCGWDEVYRNGVRLPEKKGKGIGVTHLSLMPYRREIDKYKREKFVKPADRVCAAVRQGYDEAEIVEGEKK